MTKDIKQLRLQKMVEEVEDYAILLLDKDGHIENWNKGAQKTKGYQASEIIGKHYRIFYPPEEQQAHTPERLLEEASLKGKVNTEGWRIKKNGEKFWANVVITAIHDEAGGVIGFTKVTRDITEKKLSEENLRQSEERYHKMIAEIQDYAILLIDTNGTIENWNKGAERIKGYTAAEVVGRNFRIFYPAEDVANGKPDRLLRKAAREGRAQEEGWRVRKDGTRFCASVTITALHNTQGEIIGYSKVTRDLTEVKKAEAMFLHVQKMEARNDELEQITYITSHDLQEPLRNISSFIDILVEDHSQQLDETGREMLQFVQLSAARMSQLINGLLDYGRLGRNAEIKEIDSREIMNEVISDFSIQLKETNAQITLGQLPKIKAFETEFRLLLQNLLGNALKFRQEGVPPQIEIWAEPHNGNWKFAVKDNGIGIEHQHRDRIFLIFQRLHSRQRFDGSGIGLAHCKRIVEMHHGDIWVNSEPGQGSTFYFTINTNNF